MRLPDLYQRFSRQDALRYFPGVRPYPRGKGADADWWLNDDIIVCLTTIEQPTGPRPSSSWLNNAKTLEWVANDRGGTRYPAPPEVGAGEHAGRRLFAFAAAPDRETYVYVGEMDPSYGYATDLTFATFELRAAVPSDVLATIGALPSEIAEPAELESRLHRLDHLSPPARLTLLRDMIEYWHGPLDPNDGFSEGEIGKVAIPLPLAWWYRTAGRRRDIFAQNYILGFDEPFSLKPPEEGKLTFYLENQGVWVMATLDSGEDPPVWSRMNEPGCPWKAEDVSLSTALIQAFIHEAVGVAPYCAAGAWVDEEDVETILSHVKPLPVAGWRIPVPTQFCAGQGAIGVVMENTAGVGEDGWSVFLGARTEQPLGFLREMDPELWDVAAF